jgi:TRAP-type C4-dicarboxylate transport system substrate-binding protein
MTRGGVAILLLLAASPARADELLRMATVAPEGTAYARELRAFSQRVEQQTSGRVRFKWYFGGIAGDELDVDARIRRDQLDGTASGGNLCQKLAPSLLVMRLPGLVQDRKEAAYLSNRLKPVLDQEFRANGYANLGEVGTGTAILFSRTPLRSWDDLRRAKIFAWRDDEVTIAVGRAMGLQMVPLPIYEASAAFTAGKLDVFTSPPTAALAFQWTTLAHSYTELRFNFVNGCLLLANRAMDRLPSDAQAAIRTAGAELQVRLTDALETADRQLLDGLFRRQGLTPQPTDEQLRAEFLAAARMAREKMIDKLVPRALLERVQALLADYRAERQVN